MNADKRRLYLIYPRYPRESAAKSFFTYLRNLILEQLCLVGLDEDLWRIIPTKIKNAADK